MEKNILSDLFKKKKDKFGIALQTVSRSSYHQTLITAYISLNCAPPLIELETMVHE